MLRPIFLRLAAAAALALGAAAAPAQVATVDPNTAVEEAPPATNAEPAWETEEPEYQPVDAGEQDPSAEPGFEGSAPEEVAAAPAGTASQRASQAAKGETVPLKKVLG